MAYSISPPHRFRCGKRRPTTVAQLEQIAQDRRLAPMATVLAQPHRQGNTDQRCATALGRFCMAHRVPLDVMYAAEEYEGLVRRWRAAKGVPTTVRLDAGGMGPGPSAATVRRWEAQIDGVEDELGRLGAKKAVQRLVLEDRDAQDGSAPQLLAGLWAIAVEFGWVPRSRHPFRAAA